MSLTTNAADSRLGKKGEDGQMETYFVLSEEERTKGFVRPVRTTYIHTTCGQATSMATEIAESFAKDPKMYSQTFCSKCKDHLPVSEFIWKGTNVMVGE